MAVVGVSGGFCFYIYPDTDPESRRSTHCTHHWHGDVGGGPWLISRARQARLTVAGRPGSANKGCAAAVHVPLPRTPGQSAWPPPRAPHLSHCHCHCHCQCVHACTLARARVTDSRAPLTSRPVRSSPLRPQSMQQRRSGSGAPAAGACMRACVCGVPAHATLRAPCQRGLRCATRCGQLRACGRALQACSAAAAAGSTIVLPCYH